MDNRTQSRYTELKQMEQAAIKEAQRTGDDRLWNVAEGYGMQAQELMEDYNVAMYKMQRDGFLPAPAADKAPTKEDAAQRVADFLKQHNLTNPYGGDIAKREKNGKTFLEIAFASPRTVDGSVRVYSPTYFYVGYQTAMRSLPNRGNHIFKSEQKALDFIKAAFVDLDFDEANRLIG